MHSLIERILRKKGIEDPKQLSEEEKQVFDNWQTILGKDELTLVDVKEFCKTQVGIIEMKWADYNLGQDKKAQLIPYHTVYKTLLVAIDSPKVARESLEIQLKQML